MTGATPALPLPVQPPQHIAPQQVAPLPASEPGPADPAVVTSGPAGSHHLLAIVLFTAVVLVTLAITVRAGRRRQAAEEYYAGGRAFGPLQNGLALSGDYLSAGSFLGVTGLIALYGYDGVAYLVGFLVAWLVVLMLVAELVRNTGRYTLADVIATRLRRPPARVAAGGASLVVSLLYLVAQMVGAGSLVSLLLGTGGGRAESWSILGVGTLMTVYVAVGGMRATTWIQIVKAVLLLAGSTLLTVLLVIRFHGDLGALARAAAAGNGAGRAYLQPGLEYGGSLTSRLDFLSLAVALVLGTAGLPHVISRFFTVPTARAARRSTVWAIALIGGFYLMVVLLGFGAAAVVGAAGIRAANPAGNTAVPLLAADLGGAWGSTGAAVLFAAVSATAFATVLAVVAGLTLASSAAVAHDLCAHVRRRQPGHTDTGEVMTARLATVAIGGLAVVLSLFARQANVASLVGLAFAVAASANVPALLYTLFWRRFTTRGAVWAVYGGLLSAVLLVVFSPVVSGSPTAFFPGVDFHWFPLENPGLVAVPTGFLSGWLGTVTSREVPDPGRYAELEVRSLTGAGAA